MRLESARSLKNELLGSLIAPYTDPFPGAALERSASGELREAVAALPASFAVAAQPLAGIQGIHRAIALGIAPAGRQYKLALRIQRQELRDSALIDTIRRKARNELDVRMIGRVVKRARRSAARRPWYRANVRPLLIGASVGHYQITAGTLGAFVQRDGVVCMLSNNHVLANEDNARDGDAILQRAAYDGGTPQADRVAGLSHWRALSSEETNSIDAALASIDRGIDFEPALLRGIATGGRRRLKGVHPAPLDVGERVYKLGRTTGATMGRVSAFDLDNVVVQFDRGNLRFDNQIELEGLGDRSFSDGGDSGALIVNGAMQALALLFAGSESGAANGRGLTFANPIERVLAELAATLVG